jgi:hypothetical protein
MLKELEILLMKVRISRMERKMPVLSHAELFFYESETSQLKAIFIDQCCNVSCNNPVMADNNGYFPDIFFNHHSELAARPYRIVLRDNRGVDLLHKDYINEA